MKWKKKIQNTWVMFLCILYTAKSILWILFFVLVSKPKHVDSELRVWSNNLLRTIKANWKIVNPYQFKFEPGRKYIIMSNHASLIDIPLIFMALPGNIRMLSKKELFRIPAFGGIMKLAGFPSIDRKNHRQAMRDLKAVQEQMETGMIPWIAPEGRRSRDGHLHPFKKGGFVLALQTGAIIVPIGIKGSAKIIPPDTFHFNLNQTVEIVLQPPIDANEYTLENRDVLIAAVRESIARAISL